VTTNCSFGEPTQIRQQGLWGSGRSEASATHTQCTKTHTIKLTTELLEQLYNSLLSRQRHWPGYDIQQTYCKYAALCTYMHETRSLRPTSCQPYVLHLSNYCSCKSAVTQAAKNKIQLKFITADLRVGQYVETQYDERKCSQTCGHHYVLPVDNHITCQTTQGPSQIPLIKH
jgi:hypothetical protein